MIDPERVSRKEFYPKVGNPAQKLEGVMPPFHKDFIKAAVEAVINSQLTVTLIYRNTGENPQELAVILQGPTSAGEQITVTVNGDWALKPEIPQGLPLIADYDGKFYRRENPQAQGPIAKEGDLLEPTRPMTIGIASVRKGQYWPYELESAAFPTGARITKFLVPELKEGTDVVAGETIICYVVPL